MNDRTKLAVACSALAMLCILAGCDSNATLMGYTAQNQYRTGVQTVAVPMWKRGKEVYRRDLETRLTEALIKRIELDTPYKVTLKDRADSILTGTIDQITQSTLSMNTDTGQPREIQITFLVTWTWKDLRSGQMLAERKRYRYSCVYLPSDPYNEDFFRGSEDLMDRLARRIVESMEADWGQY
jgi:hypothetical protein